MFSSVLHWNALNHSCSFTILKIIAHSSGIRPHRPTKGGPYWTRLTPPYLPDSILSFFAHQAIPGAREAGLGANCQLWVGELGLAQAQLGAQTPSFSSQAGPDFGLNALLRAQPMPLNRVWMVVSITWVATVRLLSWEPFPEDQKHISPSFCAFFCIYFSIQKTRNS